MWNANCGASFEWVGRSINPYLGFLTGWLMIAGYIIGAVAGVEVLGPSILAVFTSSSAAPGRGSPSAPPSASHAGDSVVGIRITARTQVGIASFST